MRCNGNDVDALDFEQSRSVDSMNAVGLKSRKEQSRYFGRMLRAGSRTRESAQA